VAVVLVAVAVGVGGRNGLNGLGLWRRLVSTQRFNTAPAMATTAMATTTRNHLGGIITYPFLWES